MNAARPAPKGAVEPLDKPRREGFWKRVLHHAEAGAALALSGAVLIAGLVQVLLSGRAALAEVLTPSLIVTAAAALGGLAAVGALRAAGPPSLPRQLLNWSGCLLMLWVSGGLLFDLLRVVGLIPLAVDWPGMVTRALALAATVVLAHLTLFRPSEGSSGAVPSWFGWAAFALALPYPVLKTWWALGGTLGLTQPDAFGLHGSVALWLPSVPFLLASILSLLLVPTWRRIPRWMLLTSGWTATAIAANVGPAACWSLVSGGAGAGVEGMATWVPILFYGSWLLFAVAIGGATRSYQLRTAALQ